MKNTNKNSVSIFPKNQLRLFGYNKYFDFFAQLFDKKIMPRSVLLTGPKGLGKATFVYHLSNYLLSKNQHNKYSFNELTINKENLSYRQIDANIHPNFFLIDNKPLEKDIKIEQVRNLITFLSKSTYSQDLKIILIDNANNLNLSSSNTLLKSIEEPPNNTYFFIINNNSSKLLDTLKSRCTEFKIFFNQSEKKDIFYNISKQYVNENNFETLIDNLYFDTPGNLLKYFLLLEDTKRDLSTSDLSCISFFIEKYLNDKNLETLSYICLLIQKFYTKLCLDKDNSNNFFYNQSKILKQIDNMKKFNLSEKNVLFWMKDILINDAK
tara:strand:+ start:60 stop:1031 length:972 start_codon:yes stop_codon:yes gene_type:complete